MMTGLKENKMSKIKPKPIQGKNIVQCPECKHYWYVSIWYPPKEIICLECGNSFYNDDRFKVLG